MVSFSLGQRLDMCRGWPCPWASAQNVGVSPVFVLSPPISGHQTRVCLTGTRAGVRGTIVCPYIRATVKHYG